MGYFSRILTGKSELANEFLGTLGFVLVGTSALTAASVAGQATSSVVILVGFLSFSTALGWLTYILSGQGKVQLNPAVSILLWFKGESSFKSTISAIAFQFLGALAASILVALLYGSAGVESRLGAPYPNTAMGVPASFAAELLGSIVFLGGCVVALYSGTSNRSRSATIIGVSFGVGYLLSAGVSGGALNPARALAPQLAAADLTGWWIYILAPILAAVVVGIGGRMALGSSVSSQPKSPLPKPKNKQTALEDVQPATPKNNEELEREAEQQALQEKAREAIAKLRQSNPDTRELPKTTPIPTFFEPVDEAESGQAGQLSDTQPAPEEQPAHEEPSATAQAYPKGPDVRFVKFEADEEASE